MALTLSVGAVGSIPAVAQTNVTDYPQVWEGSAQDAVSLMRFLVHNISTLPDTSAE